MTQPPTQFPPGWYPDPQNPTLVRWWDGTQWTQHAQPRQQPTQPPPAAPVQTPAEPAPEPERPAAREKVSIFNAKKKTEELQAVIDRLGASTLVQVEEQTRIAQAQLAQTRSELAQVNAELMREQSQIINVRQSIDLQEVGLFDFEHPAESSATLSTELSVVRQQIKDCIRDKKATHATTNFTFNNSTAQGKTFVNAMSKAFLAAYNSEAENCIMSVKAGNLASAQARLDRIVNQIATMGKMIDLRITPEYHRLRLHELELAARHLEAVKREKDEERERRAEQREQEKAERELRAERERLDKERQHYLNAIEVMRQRGDEAGVADLEAKIADVDHAIKDVDYRTANLRAGYVYVISNIGAFGPDMVKIGMTRRLDPMDRIRELGDASVPFRFDVHALFFADDAVNIETMLHHMFADQRVNKINAHREFFRVTPQQVLDALKQNAVHVVEYTVEPEAEEWRLSGGTLDTTPDPPTLAA